MGVGGVKLAAGTSARDDTAGHDDIIASFYSQFRVEFKLLEVLGNLGEDVLEHLLRAGERPVRGNVSGLGFDPLNIGSHLG